jgi:aspartate kinase
MKQFTLYTLIANLEDIRMEVRLRRVVVIKLGGSVLVDDESYKQAARFLVRRLHKCSEERFVVVVSARKGLTDELDRLAHRITGYPNPRTLDLLWSTGEMRSVALLTLQLEELGVPAVGLNIHETGLRCNGQGQAEEGVQTLAMQLRSAFDQHSIVVVPGFFGTLTGGRIVSLGRGGSDLSAVLLAYELEARRCELIKDVPGYFTDDPDSAPSAERLSTITYDVAIEMAGRGCELIQPVALEAARKRSLQLVVRGLGDEIPGTVVSIDAPQEQTCLNET